MVVNKAELFITAVSRSQYPTDGKPEIAFVGRSNVGKSSTINTLTGRNKLARTSSAPGKTRTINIFNIEDLLYFVDLPGYGFAKVSKSEKDKWGNMIEQYLEGRKQLKLIVQLIDIRRKPTEDDRMMNEWIKYFGYNCLIICTKADKISRSEANKNLAIIKKDLKLTENDYILPFSSEDRRGKNEAWEIIENIIKA